MIKNIYFYEIFIDTAIIKIYNLSLGQQKYHLK